MVYHGGAARCEGEEKRLSQYLDLILSDDGTEAALVLKKPLDSSLATRDALHHFLKKKGIVYGIVSDDLIDAWLAGAMVDTKQEGETKTSESEESMGSKVGENIFQKKRVACCQGDQTGSG